MLQNRLFASSAILHPKSADVEVDVGGILRRLLLFDTYVLNSIRLKEFSHLVQRLGLDGTLTLLKSGALRLHLDPTTLAQTGQATILESRARKGALPAESYCFQVVGVPSRYDYITSCFRESIDPILLTIKQRQKLKRAILDVTETPPEGIGLSALTQLHVDLRSRIPAVSVSVAKQLKTQLGLSVSPEKLSVVLHPIDDEDYRAESNLAQLGIAPEQRHRIIERAVLELGGVNQRLAEMSGYSAISGFRVHDLEIFESKVGFLVQNLDPEKFENHAQRVFHIADVPDFRDVGVSHGIDIERFLEVRDAKETKEFRAWLPSTYGATDDEIRQRILDLNARVAHLVNSPTGRVLRFLVSSALGLIPGAGTLLGLGAGALDTFVVDQVLKESAIATFVGKMYPSLFEG